MRKWLPVLAALAICTLAGVASADDKPATAAAHQHGMAAKATTDEEIVASAMKAAPAEVGKSAGVIAFGADGKVRTVREGKNGFTCMADNPETPGPDPMCADANAMAWIDAWLNHKTPPGKVGLMYMLAGGTDGSNTDPYAKKPTAENHWIETGPHVMVVGAPSLLEGYPRDADPNTKAPYVMWAGTPYEHLMIPVN